MTITPIAHIANLCQRYHESHGALTELVAELEAHLETTRKSFMPDLKRAVIKARTDRAALDAAIAASPETFVKPRKLLLNGVEVGLAKEKDALEIADEANAIKIIEEKMPALVETAIKTEKKLVLATIAGFNAESLAFIGAKMVPGADKVVIKEASSAVSKTVKALMSEPVADSIA